MDANFLKGLKVALGQSKFPIKKKTSKNKKAKTKKKVKMVISSKIASESKLAPKNAGSEESIESEIQASMYLKPFHTRF